MANENENIDEKAKASEQQHILVSPNINTDTANDEMLDEIGTPAPKVELDHEPIKESEIKFRSENIVRAKGEDLMTNVEGAEKRQEDELRVTKKHDKAVAEANKKIEKKKAHQTKKQARAARRTERRTKAAAIFKKVWELKWLILIGIIIAVAGFVIFNYMIPQIKAESDRKKIEAEKVEQEKQFEENLTPMMKIYLEIAGNDVKKDDLKEIMKKYSEEAFTREYGDYGLINLNGTTEVIYFDIETNDEGTELTNHFNYKDSVRETMQTIYDAGGIFIYSNGIDVKEYSDLKEALLDHQALRAEQ